MVYSDNMNPNGFHPHRDIAPLLTRILIEHLPLELIYVILSKAGIFSRAWCRRLETVPSRSVMSYFEYMRSVRTYLETPPLGIKALRRLVICVSVGSWRGIWPDAMAPSMLRASLIRRGASGKDVVLAHEAVEPPCADEKTSFTVILETGNIIKKAHPGDRIKITLLPHFRTRSGQVPFVKEVTLYVYSDW